MIKSQSSQYTESFSFDPAGNLIDPIATQASQVKDNLIREYQGKRYSYDAQGNVIETTQGNKTLKLRWDNLNRLIQSDHNGRITQYGYDVFGRRLYKKSQDQYGKDSLTLFGWDGDLMVWESKQYQAEADQTKNYTKHYIYEQNSFVPALQTGYSQFIKLIETPDYSQFQTMPYSIHRDPVWNTETRKNKPELERVVFYHCDQVGTPQSLSNELGECVWSIRQSTWGREEEISQQNRDNPFEQTEIRFQGQYYDEETGLHYNRYRYYEPFSGRYVSKDPIGLEGGLNNLAYVSDPNHWVDPMGLNGMNFGEMFGIPSHAQSGINYQAQRNYECYSKTGQICKIEIPPLFDYLTCSGGALGVGVGFVKNLWTDEYYLTGSKDSILVPVSKSMASGKQFSAKDLYGLSCVGGNIHNVPSRTQSKMTMGEITNEFVSGASISFGGGMFGVVGNIVKPLVNNQSPVKGAFATEVGVGLPGVNVGVSGTVSAKTILDAIKPETKN